MRVDRSRVVTRFTRVLTYMYTAYRARAHEYDRPIYRPPSYPHARNQRVVRHVCTSLSKRQFWATNRDGGRGREEERGRDRVPILSLEPVR